jgi:hypothetical protein
MVRKQKKNTSVVVRQKRGRPTKSQRGQIGFAYSNEDLKHIEGLSDPFSDAARGCKIPDDNSSKSFTLQIRDIASISSDSNGRGALTVQANLANAFKGPSAASGANMSSTAIVTYASAVGVTDLTAINTAVEKYRIVSWGVRIYSQLAPTAQSGQFRVITTPESPGDGLVYNSSFFEEIKVYPTTEDSVHWISKPVGSEWKEYKATTAAMGWEYVTIVATGLPASTTDCFTIEVVYNLELQPNLGSISGALSTDAAKHKPHVLSAAGEVLKKHGGAMVREGASNFFANAARWAVNQISSRTLGFPMITQPSRPQIANY